MPGGTAITIQDETVMLERLVDADPPPPPHRVVLAGIRLAEIYRTHEHDAAKAEAIIARLISRYPDAPELKRSEEHTSELQSLAYLVCRLLLEKKKKKDSIETCINTQNMKPTS